MTYLVDGYNLMYALGVLSRQTPPGELAAARAEFLAWLGKRLGDGAGDVTVVFDARRVPGRAPKEEPAHGLQVVFALRQEADDLIEDLIRRASAPKLLTAVSNDHRIRQAARRRGCGDWDCARFLDWLDGRGAAPPRQPPA